MGKGEVDSVGLPARNSSDPPPGPVERIRWFLRSLTGGDRERGIPVFQTGRTVVDRSEAWGLSVETLDGDVCEARHFMVLDLTPEEARQRLYTYVEAAFAKASGEAIGSRTMVECARLLAELHGLIQQDVNVHLDVSSVFARMASEAEPEPPVLTTSGTPVPELPEHAETESADPFGEPALVETGENVEETGRIQR